jgi:hypothetical protein
MDAKGFEYRIKGLEEGYWRAIQYRDVRTLRDAADRLYDTLHELADVMGGETGTAGDPT